MNKNYLILVISLFCFIGCAKKSNSNSITPFVDPSYKHTLDLQFCTNQILEPLGLWSNSAYCTNDTVSAVVNGSFVALTQGQTYTTTETGLACNFTIVYGCDVVEQYAN